MEAEVTTPQARTGSLEMLDPTFEAGATQTARATLTNPTTKEFTYTVELYLGATKAATSGIGSVTIPAGQSTDVTFTMVMPTIEGDYQPYLDVWIGTDLIAHYAATAPVTIVVTPTIIVGPITWL
jgi:hypothetical protein